MVQFWIASDTKYHKQCNDQGPWPLQFALFHWLKYDYHFSSHQPIKIKNFFLSNNRHKCDMELYMFLKWTILNSRLDFATRPLE